MKSLLIASATALALFSSCSVYREGQTPDDVYYSPGRSTGSPAYVEANGDRDDGRRVESNRSYNGYDDYATPEDRWLMMRVRDRYRWSYFDNYYGYSPYSPFAYNGFGGFGYGGFGYSPGFSLSLGLGYGSYGFYDPLWGFPYYSGFNSPYYWNSYYNPYYPKYFVVNPKTDPGGYSRMRNLNLNSYSNRNYNNNRPANSNNYGRVSPTYNNSNNNRTLGNSFRRMFSNSNNATVPRGNDYRPAQSSRPVREYSPNNNYNSNNSNSGYSPRSSGGSSGSSSSGSSSGSRPSRR